MILTLLSVQGAILANTPTTTSRSRGLGRVARGFGLVGLAWVGAGLPSFSAGATVFVLATGTVFAAVAMRPGRASGRQAVPARVAQRAGLIWALPVLLFLAIELVNLRSGSTFEAPTLSILWDEPLEHRPIRTLAILGWLCLGRWLARP